MFKKNDKKVQDSVKMSKMGNENVQDRSRKCTEFDTIAIYPSAILHPKPANPLKILANPSPKR
jgi:hypothetical protein